jgi:hypothetical protein
MLITYTHYGFDIGHMIVNSLVHGLIYGVIFKAFHGLSLPVAGFITVGVLIVLYLFFRRK